VVVLKGHGRRMLMVLVVVMARCAFWRDLVASAQGIPSRPASGIAAVHITQFARNHGTFVGIGFRGNHILVDGSSIQWFRLAERAQCNNSQ
jgi:hypothetical protein